jgi:hypothetical protein
MFKLANVPAREPEECTEDDIRAEAGTARLENATFVQLVNFKFL